MKLQLIPGVLIVTLPQGVIEVRGKPGYETSAYDSGDTLHKFLDELDPPSVAVLMTGVEYHPNRKNPRTGQTIDAINRLVQRTDAEACS